MILIFMHYPNRIQLYLPTNVFFKTGLFCTKQRHIFYCVPYIVSFHKLRRFFFYMTHAIVWSHYSSKKTLDNTFSFLLLSRSPGSLVQVSQTAMLLHECY